MASPAPERRVHEPAGPEDVPVPQIPLEGPFITTSEPFPAPPTSNLDSAGEEARKEPPVELILGAEQLANGLAWNEARIERRLRGEYERAGKQLHELVGQTIDTPLRLNAIRIVGATNTRPSFLSSIIAPYLPTLPPASYLYSTPLLPAPEQSLRTVLATARELTGLIERFEVFDRVEASIESSPSVLAEKQDVDIVLRVKEAPRFYLRTATDVGNGEGTATGTARIRNTFGGGEMLEGNVAFGTRTKSAFQLRLDTPINGSPVTHGELSLFGAQRDLNYYASCIESTKGLQVRLRHSNPLGYHDVVYEAVLRQIESLSSAASMSIRDAAGPSVKSSISHTFVRDTRDDPFLPSRGSFLKVQHEYAGLGGDADFVRSDVETALSRSLGSGYSLSFGFRAGALIGLGGKPTLFSDRYQLGGPTSVRMFRPNTMGPKDSGDHVGSDLMWATGLSLITPFPKRPQWPLKGHLFLNAGRLASVDPVRPLTGSLKNLISQPSITAGVGLMYRHSLVRIEANVGVPLTMTADEGGVKGLQFGLGMSFL